MTTISTTLPALIYFLFLPPHSGQVLAVLEIMCFRENGAAPFKISKYVQNINKIKNYVFSDSFSDVNFGKVLYKGKAFDGLAD